MRRIIAPMSPVFAIQEQAAEGIAQQLKGLDYAQAFDRAKVETALFNEDRANAVKPYRMEGGVAVISLSGAMTKYYTCATWLYGGCATSEVGFAIKEALKDDAVEKIALVIDSPGGEVAGTEALGNVIFDAREVKPIHAYIEDMACSGAYWVASQASRIWCNATAFVGNIGVYTVVRDFSEAAAGEGIKVTVVKSAERKGDGVMGSKVEDGAYEHVQELVDAQHTIFVDAVARGRGMAREKAEAVADGRVHIGQNAVEAGLVDQIGSFEDCLSDLQSYGREPGYGVTAANNLGGSMAEKKENQDEGLIAKIKSLLNSTPASQAAEGGGEGHDQSAVEREALQARINELEAEKVASNKAKAVAAANAFVDKQFAAGKIAPTEKDKVQGLYLQALESDPSGKMVAQIESIFESREPSAMTKSSLPSDANVIPSDTSAAKEEMKDRYASASTILQKAEARK